MSDIDLSCTPPEVRQVANEAVENLLPKKSRDRYELAYSKFIAWSKTQKIINFSENVLLAYFKNFEHKKSLWSTYSMLKSCLLVHKNTDISKYPKLIAFLKRETEHHKPKKSRTLDDDQINVFIMEAPDDHYLLMKVVLIMGISGACRREELCKMLVSNIVFTEIITVIIPQTKTNTSRRFVVTKREWIFLLQKYKDIRARSVLNSERFFYTYRNGRCVNSPVGLNMIGKIPSKIARYLHLDNANDFTGHCFRRSSATMLANHGGDLVTVKRHGGWRSSSVAESYIDESLQSRIAIAEKLTDTGIFLPSTSSVNIHGPSGILNQSVKSNEHLSGVSISNCENCTININIYNNASNVSENN